MVLLTFKLFFNIYSVYFYTFFVTCRNEFFYILPKKWCRQSVEPLIYSVHKFLITSKMLRCNGGFHFSEKGDNHLVLNQDCRQGGKISQLNSSIKVSVRAAVCGRKLLCRITTPLVSIPRLLFWIPLHNLRRVSQ